MPATTLVRKLRPEAAADLAEAAVDGDQALARNTENVRIKRLHRGKRVRNAAGNHFVGHRLAAMSARGGEIRNCRPIRQLHREAPAERRITPE